MSETIWPAQISRKLLRPGNENARVMVRAKHTAGKSTSTIRRSLLIGTMPCLWSLLG